MAQQSKARNLTVDFIKESLSKAGPDKEVRLYDSKAPGLVLWQRPGGQPRWYLFKRVGPVMKRAALGDLNTLKDVPLALARTLAATAIGQLAGNVDITAAKRIKRQLQRGGRFPFRDLLAFIQARMESKGRSPKHTAERMRIGQSLVDAGLLDLADPRACGIAEKWINAQTCSDLTKHRYGMHVRALGRAAVKKYDDLPRDPFRALEVGSSKIPAPALFTLEEISRLVSDDALTTPWGRLFAFLIYTGSRMREGMYSRWSRVDLTEATFSIVPPTQAEREAGEAVKRDKGRTVNLQPELIEILHRMPRIHGDFLFPKSVQMDSGNTTRAFRDHLNKLNIPVEGRHIHSLRHAHVTLSVAAGVPDLQLRLSVGHGGPAMTAYYANAAMLWRAKLKDWRGTFRLRTPAGDVDRLTG